MQLAAAQPRHTALDRPSGQFMPKGDAVGADLDHPTLFGLVQCAQFVTENVLGDGEHHQTRNNAQLFQGAAAARGEPADPGDH